MVVAAVAIGVGTAVAGVAGAEAQKSSAAAARRTAQGQYANDQAMEQPFQQAGYDASNQLEYLEGIGPQYGADGTSAPSGINGAAGGYGSLNAPFTAQTFQQYSPAYQFQAQQGRNGVLNGDSSGAGALSGAAQKDLIGYNQNFANTSFNNAFSQYQTQQNNTYARLSGIADRGQSATGTVAGAGTSLANTAAQAQIAGGNAQANAYSSLSNGALSAYGAYNYGSLAQSLGSQQGNQAASYGGSMGGQQPYQYS